MKQGLVHIYTGDGKGKTSSAVGLCTRALGWGKKVLFVQFLKALPTGEVESLGKLGAQIIRRTQTTKFVFYMNEQEKSDYRKVLNEQFAEAKNLIMSGSYDLVILDEVLDVIDLGMLEEQELIFLVSGKPESTELVLTGRRACDALIEAAHYHTGFAANKHPFEKGIKAREGIEF